MTTAWPPAPAGRDWRHVDLLLDLADPVVASESRSGGVHQVRWEPSRRTRVAYDRVDGGVEVAEFTADGVTRTSMLDDPALPGITEVLDTDALARRLRNLVVTPVRSVAVTPVSYRPRSRCVVRVDLDTDDGAQTLYVKLLAEGVAAYVDSHVAIAAAGVAAGEPEIVPRLLGAWTDLGAVVTVAAPGRPASRILADDTVPLPERQALAIELGGLLATVHRSVPRTGVTGDAHTSLDEVAELETYLPPAWHADPAAAVSLTWALNTLAEDVPPSRTLAYCHGSFRAGQVVVENGRLSLLDLDSAGMSDPARDVGNAMAYLDWRDLRQPVPAASTLSTAFRDGYAAHGGLLDQDAVDWWHASSLLKIAGRRYRSLDTAHWAAIPGLVRAATDLLERRGSGSVPTSPDLVRCQADVLEPDRMTPVVAPLLHAAVPGSTPVLTSAEVLRVAHGRRIVVSYAVSGVEGVTEVIGKAYADPSRASTTHENLTVVGRHADPVLGIGTQRPLGVLPDRGLVVFGSAPGTPATDLPAAAASVAAGQTGTWLRRLHDSHDILRRTVDVRREVANARLWAEEAAAADPRLERPALAVADLLQERVTRMPLVATAPVHKDLHLGHVLVDDHGHAVVIDMDEARMGDPLLDVAHVCAYADELGPTTGPVLREAFLDAYGRHAGPDPALRFAFYLAYTALKITKQAVRDESVGLTDAVVAQAVDRLTKGAACLAG